jgi:autotransporter-associated beta strand protein
VAVDTATFNLAGSSGPETIFLNGNESAASLTFSNTGATTISTGTSGGPMVNNQSLTLTGGITINSGAGAVAIGTSVANNNVLLIANGSQSFTNNSSSLFTIGNGTSTSAISLQGGAGAPSVITIGGTGNTTVTGEIKDGSGGTVSVVKNGAGALELDGNAAGTFFTGGLTVNAGMLNLKGSNALGTTANTLTINGGGVASVGSARTIPAAINLVIGGDFTLGTSTSGGLAITFNGSVNLGGATRSITFNNSATFGGVISNGGITKANSGTNITTLTLGGVNTYAGPTTINSGTITASTSGAFSSNSAFTVPSGTTLNLAGFSQTIASLSDGGGGAGGSVLIGNLIGGVLTTGGDNSNTTFSGVISGNASTSGGGLIKNGTGTFTLSSPTGNFYGTAANSVSTVNNGTLSVTNTSNSATGPGAVSVTAGIAPGGPFGTLGGTGIIAGPVSVNAGTGGGPNGVIQPGTVAAPIATLTLQSNLTLPGTYNATIDPTSNNSSLLAVNGVLDLTGGASTLNVSSLPGASSGATYILATFGSLNGTFTNTFLPSGYMVNYAPTAISISPVPEPACIMLACAGAAGGLGWWRRRR